MTLSSSKAWMTLGAAACLLLALPSAHAQGRGPGGGRSGGMPGGPRPTFGHDGGGRGNLPAMNGPRMEGGGAAGPARGNVQLGPPGRWWDNSSVARSVGLRKEQQKRMDTIFNSNKSALIQSYQTLQREEAKLASISKQPQPDKAQLFAAIDSVNQARASLEKVTTQMLLQIREQLDSDQIGRVEALRESQLPADR